MSRVRKGSRHALPAQLGGQRLDGRPTFETVNQRIAEGWAIRSTRLTEEYDAEAWRADRPNAIPILTISKGQLCFVGEDMAFSAQPQDWITAFVPSEHSGNSGEQQKQSAAEASEIVKDHQSTQQSGS